MNKNVGKKGQLFCIYKGDKPLHTLYVDHLGPMDHTFKHKINRYIFAAVDAFTTFGHPVRLINDRGVAFLSN